MALKPGDDYSDRGVDESVKSLFATGLFANVQIRREGSSLVVTVEENPIINEIAFEGNDRFDDTKLTAEIEERPRQVYTRTKAQSDADRIQQLYRRSGRFAVAVEPKIIKLDQNRVNLVFEIREGDLAKIERINFVGNRAFSNGELRDEILTKETEWWNILASNDTYDPDRLAVDQEMLRRYYLNRGYADFRVVSAVSELAPDGEGFFITFTVDEGERYKFGKIDVNSALPGVTPEELQTVIVSNEGDWYSSKSVEDTIQALTTYLGDRQYAFVDIQPSVQRNRDEHLIAITYEISEGPRVFVERIDISGNVRTADEVIRREFELAEGDPFNASRLKKSETNIRNLGFFSKVDIKPIQGSAPDQTVVQAAVTEQSTGEVQLGVGYSTSDGPLGDVTIRERNLLGRGQDLRLSTSLSGVSSQIDLSFTEPYFLGRNLAAGFDLFRTTRDNQSFSSYDETNTGFALRLGYPLTRESAADPALPPELPPDLGCRGRCLALHQGAGGRHPVLRGAADPQLRPAGQPHQPDRRLPHHAVERDRRPRRRRALLQDPAQRRLVLSGHRFHGAEHRRPDRQHHRPRRGRPDQRPLLPRRQLLPRLPDRRHRPPRPQLRRQGRAGRQQLRPRLGRAQLPARSAQRIRPAGPRLHRFR